MRTLSTCHLIVGGFGIIIFLLTGHYMDFYHNHLQGMADGQRMLYRSSHIYFLLSCIINICLSQNVITAKSYLRMAISVVILLSPAILLMGFFIEPNLTNFHRPYSRFALYALFGASILLLALNLYQRKS